MRVGVKFNILKDSANFAPNLIFRDLFGKMHALGSTQPTQEQIVAEIMDGSNVDVNFFRRYRRPIWQMFKDLTKWNGWGLASHASVRVVYFRAFVAVASCIVHGDYEFELSREEKKYLIMNAKIYRKQLLYEQFRNRLCRMDNSARMAVMASLASRADKWNLSDWFRDLNLEIEELQEYLLLFEALFARIMSAARNERDASRLKRWIAERHLTLADTDASQGVQEVV
jgi:hypothetical protein